MSKQPKVALITGAARRIGAEIARTLHKSGMNVVLHYNTSDIEANKLSVELNTIREKSAVALRADLLQIDSEKSLIAQAMSAWNRLDVLVNNASRFYRTPVDEVSIFVWDDLMISNVRAPYFLAQAAHPYLKATKGSIINITDIHSDRPLGEYSVYCITKAALVMMTKSLAKEMGPDVRVNGVAPGAIIWPEGKNILSDEQKTKILAHTALNRIGEATDISKTVLFLVQEANYITGQIINVDGGRTIS